MFKIVSSKKWNDLIESTEYEIRSLEAHIKTNLEYIKEGVPKGAESMATNHRWIIEKCRNELPLLHSNLENRRQFLKVLKGD